MWPGGGGGGGGREGVQIVKLIDNLLAIYG